MTNEELARYILSYVSCQPSEVDADRAGVLKALNEHRPEPKLKSKFGLDPAHPDRRMRIEHDSGVLAFELAMRMADAKNEDQQALILMQAFDELRAEVMISAMQAKEEANPKSGLYSEIKRTAMSGRTIRCVAEAQATEPIEETYNEIHFDDSLEEIQRKAWVNSERHGFHGTATDSELMALIASEAFEAFEVTREAGPMTEDKRAHYAEELADIVIRAGDVATILEIDLGQAVQLKHAFNLTRPFRHGKAK